MLVSSAASTSSSSAASVSPTTGESSMSAKTAPLTTRQNSNDYTNGFHNGAVSPSGTKSSQSEHASNKSWSSDDGLQVENNTPVMMLKCADCGICKSNSEDMEIHIKMEHLNWLPFQCPVCSCLRASDAQMREHLHSSHRSNTTLFHYVDNVSAKRRLQKLMDDSLIHAVGKKKRTNGSVLAATNNNGFGTGAEDATASDESTVATPAGSSPLHPSNGTNGHSTHVHNQRKRPAPVLLPSSAYADTFLANFQAACAGQAAAAGDSDECLTGDPIANDPVLENFFAKRVKTEYDDDEGGSINGGEAIDISMLDNVAALFTNGMADDGDEKFSSLMKSSSSSSLVKAAMAQLMGGSSGAGSPLPLRGSNTPRYAGTTDEKRKKRVLGECSKCQKPVTAGARQMHMFFHLGKDYNIYRFRCKYPACAVEHYRKDQMENHHSKQHGKIDPDMMEDRSLELFGRCQELSMELLGTNGSTPGPTAARALVAYNAQSAGGSSPSTPTSLVPGGMKKPKRESDMVGGSFVDDHPLECRLCHKTMQNRIRGFHILWHMAKDLGINRYTCKLCDFGHDRSQSVQTHGKREHGREDIVEDRIDEYTEEVKQMSESCFGYQALFSAESRRRSKIPLASARRDEEEKFEAENAAADDGEAIIEHDGMENDDNDDDDGEGENGGEGGEGGEDKFSTNLFFAGMNEKELKELPPLLQLAAAMSGNPLAALAPMQQPKKTPSTSVKRKQISKDVRVQMAKLRDVSMLVGGAQYFKKKINEQATCMKCGMLTPNRMSDHVYKHLNAYLFCCPHCDLGHYSREIVVRHIRDMHRSSALPGDKRLQFALQIKDMVRECYPQYFIDAPLPNEEAINKLKQQIGVDEFNRILGGSVEDEEGALKIDEEKDTLSPTDGSSMLDEEEDDGMMEE